MPSVGEHTMELQPHLAGRLPPNQELPWSNGFTPCFPSSVAAVWTTGRCLLLLLWGAGEVCHLSMGLSTPVPSCHPPVYLLGLQSFKQHPPPPLLPLIRVWPSGHLKFRLPLLMEAPWGRVPGLVEVDLHVRISVAAPV